MACLSTAASDELLEREGFDMNLLRATATPPADARPNLASYSRIIVAFSGGKDATALVLRLLDEGVPREKIELHHHLVDGNEGSTLLDWPITEGYCKAFAQALDLDITFSWRAGGLERELLRDNSSSAPAMVPAEGGGYIAVGGRGPIRYAAQVPTSQRRSER